MNGHFQIIVSLLYAHYPIFFLFSYRIAMLYIVHKYKKKLDLTHSKIMIFLAFLVKGYGCSKSHKIAPFTIGC